MVGRPSFLRRPSCRVRGFHERADVPDERWYDASVHRTGPCCVQSRSAVQSRVSSLGWCPPILSSPAQSRLGSWILCRAAVHGRRVFNHCRSSVAAVLCNNVSSGLLVVSCAQPIINPYVPQTRGRYPCTAAKEACATRMQVATLPQEVWP